MAVHSCPFAYEVEPQSVHISVDARQFNGSQADRTYTLLPMNLAQLKKYSSGDKG